MRWIDTANHSADDAGVVVFGFIDFGFASPPAAAALAAPAASYFRGRGFTSEMSTSSVTVIDLPSSGYAKKRS